MIFATHDQNAKIRTAKIQHVNFCVKNLTRENLRTCVLCAIVSLDLMTALHHYFKPADDVLPSPTGDLSASVSPATIKGRGPKLALALNTKIKTTKISSGGEMGFSRKFGPAKIWTRKNFPPYSIFSHVSYLLLGMNMCRLVGA